MASDDGVTWATTWTVWPAGTSTGVGSNVTIQPVGAVAVIATPAMSAVPLFVKVSVRSLTVPAVRAHVQALVRGREREAVATGDLDREIGVGRLAAAGHVDRDRIVAGRGARPAALAVTDTVEVLPALTTTLAAWAVSRSGR